MLNRILVDSSINDISDDCNLLINNSMSNYEFNIVGCNVNILCIKENSDDITLKFNIKNANLVFNIIGYNNKDIKIEAVLNEGGNIELYNSLVSRKKEYIDINILHNYKDTKSNIYNCGTTDDNGSITFNVVSKVLKKNTNCYVNQDSKIIVFNDDAVNKINPVLLIDEYEVNARHSAYIGDFNEDELFYLESRGLSKKEASNLLLDGFLIGVLKINNEEKELLKDKLKTNWR